MSREEVTSCDNPDCNGGSDHYYQCGNGHDICEFCAVRFVPDDEEGPSFCPVCLEKAVLK